MAGPEVDTVGIRPTLTLTVERAGSDELLRRFVRFDGARCAANDDRVLGVCRTASTKALDKVPVDAEGVVLVEAGAAIALSEGGAEVMSDAQGRAVPKTGTNPSAGTVLKAASAAGDLVPILLNH